MPPSSATFDPGPVGHASDPAGASSRVGLWDWNVETDEAVWTDSIFHIAGVSREKFVPSYAAFLTLVHPDDRARLEAAVQATLTEEAPFEIECRLCRPDGGIVCIFNHGAVVRDGGRPVRMIGSLLDVTSSRQREESALRLAAIVESSDDAILSKDLNGVITTWNASAQRIFGYSAAEAIGQPVTMLIPAQRRDEEPDILSRIRRGEKVEHYETVRQRKDGSLVDIALTVSPIRDGNGRIVGASKIARDITERRKAQAALRESEERFRLLASHAPVGIFLSDAAGHCIFVNDCWTEMSGLPKDAATGEGWAQAVHPDDRGAVLAGWQEAVRQGTVSRSEFRFQQPDGRVVWLRGDAVPFRDHNGFRGYLGTCIDITERKQAEMQTGFLQALTDRLANLDDPDAILMTAQTEVGEYLRTDRCYFFEIDAARKVAHVIRDWHRPDLAPIAGRHPLPDFGTAAFVEMLQRPRQQIADVREHPATRDRSGSYAALRIRSLATASFWDEGSTRLSLAVTRREPRVWSREELALLEHVATRAWPLMARARSARASRESETRWRQLAEAMPHLVWTCRADGYCDYLSPQWVAYTGAPEASQLGGGWLQFVHPEDRPALEGCWQRAVETGGEFDTEFRIRRADGQYRAFRTRAVPVRDGTARIVKWYGTNTDIEDYRRIEVAIRNSEHQLRLVTDQAAVYLVHVDRDYRFKFVNRSYARRYGLAPDAILGRTIAEITGEEAWLSFKEHFDGALGGRRVEFEQEIPYLSLGRRWVHAIFEPERSLDGAVVGVVAVIADVTSRKQVEFELARARDEAVAASRAKDDFLAALSHELRTPLSPVLLVASDAANNPSLPRDIRASFEMIRANVSLEARLIDDLLDLTRITRGKLPLERQPISLHDVLRDAAGNLRPEVEAKDLVLEVQLRAERALVSGDAVRLQQVFWNILKNAVKFTPDGGRISVATTVATEPDRIVVEVTDTGLGMTAGELARVFDMFAQGDHATATGSHRFGGLGLGLAISQRLVEMHDGRIRAQSEGRNRGASFVVELPLLPAERASEGSPAPFLAPAPLPAPTGRILLIEDHAATRETLQKLLTRRKFEVHPAASAAEARALAAVQTFDYVISDVGLPDGDGYQLMTELRQVQPHLLGIAISGYGMEDDLQRSQTAGFAAHLVKPVGITALERALEGLTRGGPR